LPLFAAASAPPSEPPPQATKLSAALDAIDPNELTPREAMDVLYRLMALRSQQKRSS
jgi:DNA mismatch repair protein MutS